MSDEKKESAKRRVAIIGIGLVIGIGLLLLGGEGEKAEKITDGAEEYRVRIESELEALCGELTGGEVSVFLTLEGGYGYTYALDSRGGVLTVGNGSSERAVVQSTEAPEISGVGVVYRGESNVALEGELLRLVSSSLGVGSNKIFIIGSKKEHGQS